MIKILYHTSSDNFSFNLLLQNKLGGYTTCFIDSFKYAKHYGEYVFTCKVNLQRKINNNRITIDLYEFLDIYETLYPEASYMQIINCSSIGECITNLLKHNKTDISVTVEIARKTNNLKGVYNVLRLMGYNYYTDKNRYFIFDSESIKIKSITNTHNNLNESISNLNQAESKSKTQRRLMAMALAYKRGKLDKKYASDTVKKLADSISEEKLHQFATTKQKKRRKDGSIGKRNAIPYKVKKSK